MANADAGSDPAVRLARGVLGYDGETTFAREGILRPSLRRDELGVRGKIDETRTRFCAARPASRSASSNEVRRSLCASPCLFVKMSVIGGGGGGGGRPARGYTLGWGGGDRGGGLRGENFCGGGGGVGWGGGEGGWWEPFPLKDQESGKKRR